MTELELRKIIQRREGLKLDFKREMYHISHPEPLVQKKHWGELIKDILSLINGNVGTARETAYLILGVGDDLYPDGSRDLFDIGDVKIEESQLIKKLNAYCDPPIADINCEKFILDDKKILVISIPPSPHLHETSQKIDTKGATYSERVTFIRRSEGICIASASERAYIAVEKKEIFRSTADQSASKPKLCVVTVAELFRRNWCIEKIIENTMKLDYDTLSGLVPEHEGEHDQWVSIVVDHPETVQILLNEKEEIVGYWHFAPLFPKEFKMLKNGELSINNITSDKICLMELPGVYDIYFVVMTVLPEYRQVTSIRLLFESFLDTAERFAEEGIFFREVCIDAYTNYGIAICKSFGMKLLSKHQERGEIYVKKFFPFPRHLLFSERTRLKTLYSVKFNKSF